jgi:hypothetical protein
VSVVCNCCCSSSAQSFSGPNPAGLTTIFYCLRFEISPFVASYYSQGYGGDIRPNALHCKGGRLTLFTKIFAIYFENRAKIVNALCGKKQSFLLVCYSNWQEVKLSLYLIKHHAMNTYGAVKVWFQHSWPRQ